jgi:arabinose operon protein AraL
MPWVLDLDGVVWLGDEPIAGSAKAIETLRAKGERVLFLTNNSSQTVNTYVEKMARMGFACSAEDLCSSAQAAALLVNPGETALVIGGKGIEEALLAGGSIPVHDQRGLMRSLWAGIVISTMTVSPWRFALFVTVPA